MFCQKLPPGLFAAFVWTTPVIQRSPQIGWFSRGCYLAVQTRPTMFRPALLVFSQLLVSSIYSQTSVVLYSTRDCPFAYHDNYNTANTNYNSAVHFSAFAQPGASGGVNAGRSVVEFDLSSIPTDSTVVGAFLSVSARGPWAGRRTAHGGIVVDVPHPFQCDGYLHQRIARAAFRSGPYCPSPGQGAADPGCARNAC